MPTFGGNAMTTSPTLLHSIALSGRDNGEHVIGGSLDERVYPSVAAVAGAVASGFTFVAGAVGFMARGFTFVAGGAILDGGGPQISPMASRNFPARP